VVYEIMMHDRYKKCLHNLIKDEVGMKNLRIAISATILSIMTSSFACAHDGYRLTITSGNGKEVLDKKGDCIRAENTFTTYETCGYGAKFLSEHLSKRVIYFDFNSSALNDSEKEKLEDYASFLRENDIKHVKVVGFTDRIGGDKYNEVLSFKRANAVEGYLSSIAQLKRKPVEVRGLGKSHEVKHCEGEFKVKTKAHKKERNEELIECLAPNRRVEVEVDYVKESTKYQKPMTKSQVIKKRDFISEAKASLYSAKSKYNVRYEKVAHLERVNEEMFID
jgi:OOP family OmpA-OmpF porin